MTSIHQREHEEMIGLADAILGAVAQRQIGEPTDLAQKRLAFARLVNKHCDEEGATMRKAVTQGVVARSLVASFHRELLAWRTDLALCNSEWPLARVLNDPKGFGRRFGAIVHALRDYTMREDREILSVIASHHKKVRALAA